MKGVRIQCCKCLKSFETRHAIKQSDGSWICKKCFRVDRNERRRAEWTYATIVCLNLAMTVATVLYDRQLKDTQ